MRNLSKALQVCIEPEAADLPQPRVAKSGDVGFDLYTARDTEVPPGGEIPPTDVPCGIAIKVPDGTWGLILPRSSTYKRFPFLRLCFAPIDGGYTGALTVRVQNLGTQSVIIERGSRIAQLVLFSAVVPKVVLVKHLPDTERGGGKYGSTGK